jgi:hypothetical protein
MTRGFIERTKCQFDLPCGPAIDAVVLDVRANPRLVILDKGQRDGVKVGYVFDVFLNRLYKGHIVIQDVQQTTCAGVVKNEMSPFEKGDSATTSL